MKTIQNSIVLFATLFSMQSFATVFDFTSLQQALMPQLSDVQTAQWKAGDTASYKMKLGFLSGTMKMSVKSVNSEELVITQEINLAGMGGQSCDMTLDPSTGETKRIVCNGQDQQVQKPDLEVIDMKDADITVPAGKFSCMYIKIRNKADNSEIEQWANQDVPVAGMVKTIAPSQLGKMTVELSSFKKN